MRIMLVRAASFWMRTMRRNWGNHEMPLESHWGKITVVTVTMFPKPELCFSHTWASCGQDQKPQDENFSFNFSPLQKDSLGQPSEGAQGILNPLYRSAHAQISDRGDAGPSWAGSAGDVPVGCCCQGGQCTQLADCRIQFNCSQHTLLK